MADNSNTYGSADRAVVSDPNADLARAIAPTQIQQGGVTSGAHANMSGVANEQETISKLFGAASNIAMDYFDKQKDQWNKEGEIAYAQGKTQQEIFDSGNKYTMAGWQSMNVRTSANKWYQNSVDEINNNDKQISPTDYAKKLSQNFSQLQDSIGNNADVYTKDLLSGLASQDLPKLAELQVHANNEFNHQKQIDSYTNMLISETQKSDPTESPEQKTQRLLKLTSPSMSGLDEETHKAAVTNAIQEALKLGSPDLMKAAGFGESQRIAAMNLGGTNPELTQAVHSVGTPPADLAHAVEGVESNHNPNAVNVKSGAVGSMQTLPSTLKDPGFGVKPAQNNSPEEQARVGRDYLQAMMQQFGGNQSLALAAYNWGIGHVNKLIAKIGDPSKGEIDQATFNSHLPAETKSYLTKVDSKLNATPGKALIYSAPINVTQAKNAGGETFSSAVDNTQNPASAPQPQEVNVAAQGITDKQATLSALVKAGYTPAQIDTVSNAYSNYQDQVTNNFNEGRIAAESQIRTNAELTGNLPQALDNIKAIAKANGYSNEWMNAQGEAASSAVRSGLNARIQMQKLQSANSNNTLQSLSEGDRNDAMALKRQSLSADIGNNPDIPKEAKDAAFRQKYGDYLIQNKAVDSSWGQAIDSALTGNILDAKGNVSKTAQHAYDDYLYLSKNGTPGFAQKFLGTSKDLIFQAEALNSGGINSNEALRAAAAIMDRKTNGTFKEPTVDPAEIDKAVETSLNNSSPSFWTVGSSITGADKTSAMSYFDVRDSDVTNASKDPNIKAVVSADAHAIMLNNPHMTPAAAAGQAMAGLQARIERVGDNVLVGSKTSTVAQDMKLQDTRQGAVEKAVLDFASQHGDKLWGEDWKTAVSPVGQIRGYDAQGNPKYLIGSAKNGGIPQPSLGAIGSSVSDYLHGTPRMFISYDSALKTITYDLYAHKDSDVLLGRPRTIPAEVIGRVHDYKIQTTPIKPGIIDTAVNAVGNLLK